MSDFVTNPISGNVTVTSGTVNSSGILVSGFLPIRVEFSDAQKLAECNAKNEALNNQLNATQAENVALRQRIIELQSQLAALTKMH